jgi:hypothetical protein
MRKLINGNARADIELSDGRGRQLCHGPVWDGLCPLAARDGRVPCAGGRVLALRGTWADGAWLEVGDNAGPECPLAGMVTRVPAPWDVS